MKTAIMQPYFLPYIGYFQLINAVDIFVLYDDVTYIKQGWINRNKILLNNKPFLFSLEVLGASSNKEINLVKVGKNRFKLLKSIEFAYKKAPYFDGVMPVLKRIFESEEDNLVEYIYFATTNLTNYLGITTKIIISSEIPKEKTLFGQDKVLKICKSLNTTTYINSIGGYNLYSKTDFELQHITLQFLKSYEIKYTQFSDPFIPWLSIIDVLMFNEIIKVTEFLNKYELI